MLIAFVSAKGSPGVTTSVLALASRWPRTAVVVEADPAGGDVAAGLGRGTWPAGAALPDLVVDLRTTSADVALRHRALRPSEHSPVVLAGLGSPAQAAAVPWERLATEWARIPDADVLLDCGRFTPDGVTRPLVHGCDRVVLVARSTLPSVRAAARSVPALDGDAGLSVLVVAPDAPYSAEEVATGCRLPLAGVLPDDPRAARVWSDGARPGRWFARSALQRAATAAAGRLAATSAGGHR